MAMITYLNDLFAFSKVHQSTLERGFVSPFGLAGAFYSGFFFVLSAISILFFLENHTAGITLAVFVGTLTVIYWLYVRHHQVLSDDEQQTLFKLMVVKFNKNKKKVVLHHHHRPQHGHHHKDHNHDPKENSVNQSRLFNSFSSAFY